MHQTTLGFAACVALALHDGITNLPERGDGTYDRTVGPWRVFLNASKKDVCPLGLGGKPLLPPFHAYLEFNGWPAGIVSPHDGTIAAGDAANEDTFIAAIEKEIGETVESFLSKDRAAA